MIHNDDRDVMIMPADLDAFAQQQKAEGYQVERGVDGAVIIKLADGEIHFIPAAGCVEMVVFLQEALFLN